MVHQPDPEGPQMHDATLAFPDIYEHPEWYDHGGDPYTESLGAIREARGNPDADIDIYRAVPQKAMGINPGDWVSTSKSYARQHGMHATDPGLDWPVAHKRVRARDLRTDCNDVNEWGYFPEED